MPFFARPSERKPTMPAADRSRSAFFARLARALAHLLALLLIVCELLSASPAALAAPTLHMLKGPTAPLAAAARPIFAVAHKHPSRRYGADNLVRGNALLMAATAAITPSFNVVWSSSESSATRS